MEIEQQYYSLEEICIEWGKTPNFLINLGESGTLPFVTHKTFSARRFINEDDQEGEIVNAAGWFIIPKEFLGGLISNQNIFCRYLYGFNIKHEYYPHALLKQQFPVGCIDFNGHTAVIDVKKNEIFVRISDKIKFEEEFSEIITIEKPCRKGPDPEKTNANILKAAFQLIKGKYVFTDDRQLKKDILSKCSSNGCNITEKTIQKRLDDV